MRERFGAGVSVCGGRAGVGGELGWGVVGSRGREDEREAYAQDREMRKERDRGGDKRDTR